MHVRHIVAALLVAASLGVIAQAQQRSNGWTGVNPREIKFQPVDISKAIKAPSAAGGIKITTPNVTAGPLNRFLHNYSGFSGLWRSVVPSTPVLATKDNIYQPNPPKGINYFPSTTSK